MSTIVARAGKGASLSWDEADANFTNLNTDKVEVTSTRQSATSIAGTYTFTDGSPASDRYEFDTSDPDGWRNRAHTFICQFDIVGTGFWSVMNAGNGAHAAIVTHCDLDQIATNVRGNGLLMGWAANGTSESPNWGPTTIIETWYGGTAATNDNRIFPGTEGFKDRLLTDGVTYRVFIYSTVDVLGNKWIRHQYYRKKTTVDPEGSWDMESESGYVLDHNQWADFTKKGLVFAHVFMPSGGWSLDISNIKYSWGPPEAVSTANRKFSAGIGTSTGQLNVTNLNTAQIITDSASVFDFSTIDVSGEIAALIEAVVPGAFTLNQRNGIETVVRPIYTRLAYLMYLLQQRGVL